MINILKKFDDVYVTEFINLLPDKFYYVIGLKEVNYQEVKNKES